MAAGRERPRKRGDDRRKGERGANPDGSNSVAAHSLAQRTHTQWLAESRQGTNVGADELRENMRLRRGCCEETSLWGMRRIKVLDRRTGRARGSEAHNTTESPSSFPPWPPSSTTLSSPRRSAHERCLPSTANSRDPSPASSSTPSRPVPHRSIRLCRCSRCPPRPVLRLPSRPRLSHCLSLSIFPRTALPRPPLTTAISPRLPQPPPRHLPPSQAPLTMPTLSPPASALSTLSLLLISPKAEVGRPHPTAVASASLLSPTHAAPSS